jgi:hypothetical protein
LYSWERKILLRFCRFELRRECTYNNITVNFKDVRKPATFISPKSLFFKENKVDQKLGIFTYNFMPAMANKHLIKMEEIPNFYFNSKDNNVRWDSVQSNIVAKFKNGASYEKILILKKPSKTDKSVLCEALPSEG